MHLKSRSWIWISLCLVDPVKSFAQPDTVHDAPAQSAQTFMDEAYRHKGLHELEAAKASFLDALHAGANPQVVWLELGHIAKGQNDLAGAATAFRQSLDGNDAELTQEATRELDALAQLQPSAADGPVSTGSTGSTGDGIASTGEGATSADALLSRAYQRKEQHDVAGAEASFRAAEQAGADAQLVALELAYLALERQDAVGAKLQLTRAAKGADAERRAQAQRELAGLSSASPPKPRHLWGDLYAEAYGWSRRVGAERESDLVPTLRLRAYYRPSTDLDLHFYLFGQVTRDLASRGANRSGLPLIYADNSALLGPGVMFRFWSGRIGIFAQIGPAIELVDDTRKRVRLDARAGAQIGLESAHCFPAARSGSAWELTTCQELYGEVTYVNRYDNDVVAFVRGRSSLGFAITGPVAWQLAGELRAGKDSNGDYYNNFVDAGLGLRLRLLAPFHADLMLAPHVGTYFGESHIDPAPSPLHYVDLRLQAATYLEF